MFTDEFTKLRLTGWFPGHMLKAGREMREALKLVDLVVELVDARAPLATRNPALRELLASKPFIIVANKADLSDKAGARDWKQWFDGQGLRSFFLSSPRLSNVQELTSLWKNIVAEERAARGATRPLTRPVRLMIVGIPNIGKSTLINHLHLKNKAITGPKPGVTRQNQWIPLRDNLELLDTPGVLWPRIADKRHELLLAALGNLSEDIAGTFTVAEFLAALLLDQQRTEVWEKLGLTAVPSAPDQALEALAARRGFLQAGAQPDLERAAVAFLKEFRDGKLGRMTLQPPPQPKQDD